MFQINTKLNKFRIPLLLFIIGIGGLFLFQYLTFIPSYSSAESKSISTDTPATITPITPLAKWEDLEYMQQMSPEACSSATESTASTGDTYQKQLIDVRDGKTYWVARIGNDCWMTQNLDLDLSTAKPLTPDDSNVTTSWTPIEDTQTTASPSGFTGTNPIKSWDPGYAYYANGTTKTTTGVDESWAKDTSGTNVNTHYLQGNYYTWVAAMAGNTTGDTSDSSICPKGWQLPLSNSSTNPKTFQALTNALGATSGTSVGASDAKLLVTPVYFVRGGDVGGTALFLASTHGYYWSSTAYDSSESYNLTFNSSSVFASNGSSTRCSGSSVRCVAQTTSSETPVDPSVGGTTGINDPNVSVAVPNILTMSISDSVVDIEASTNKVNEGNFTASVSSNAPYSIAISTTEDGHTDLTNENGSGAIPTLSSTSPVITTDYSKWWGIKCINPDTSTNCQKTTYTGLTDYLHPTIYFKSATAASNQLTTFTIGIKTSSDLPSGTYSTNILVTASQN